VLGQLNLNSVRATQPCSACTRRVTWVLRFTQTWTSVTWLAPASASQVSFELPAAQLGLVWYVLRIPVVDAMQP
jgi:hypothetical protein